MSETPDVVGTVRGYRSWELLPSGRLKACVNQYVWTTGVNRGLCGGRDQHWTMHGSPKAGFAFGAIGQVPVKDCTCGMYACTSPYSSAIHTGVFGVVEMSGGIVEHERNAVVRAGKATIAGLVMPPWEYTAATIRSVKLAYPGVRIFSSRPKLLKAFPPTVPVKGYLWRRIWPDAITRFVGTFQAGLAAWDFTLFAQHGAWLDLFGGLILLSMAAVSWRPGGLGGVLVRARRRRQLRREQGAS